MKQAEIEVGGEYLTRISGALIRVRVVAAVEREGRVPYGSATYAVGPGGAPVLSMPRGKTLTRFRVARVDTGATLPKVRTASALHKPSLDPFEASLSRELKADPAKKPELQAQFIAYRFIKTINGQR